MAKNDEFNFDDLSSPGGTSDLFSSVVNKQGIQGGTTPQADARTGYGDLEISKHLYKTGLQSIFNDYQKNIATLDQSKQQSLQEAYTIKRMSKKYLGEYASNVGVGDVSGQLLDIYGNYQQNLQQIQQNFGELQVGLQQQYNQERQEIMNNLLLTKHNIQAAQLNEQTNQILFNAMTGNTEGLTPFEYLEQNREMLGERNFRAVYEELYNQTLEEVTTNIQQGFFGYREDENGEMVRQTDPKEYLRQFKGTLNESHYNMLQGALPQPATQDIAFNIMRGEYGGFDNGFDYLESIRDTISQEQYVQFYSAIRDNVVNELRVRAETNFFGFEGEGENRVPITAEDYLQNINEQYGSILGNELEFAMYREQIEFNKVLEAQFNEDNKPIQVNDVRSPQRINPETGETEDNPFFNPNLDLYGTSLFSGDDFDRNSQAFNIEGQNYVRINSSVDKDEIGFEKFGVAYARLDSGVITDDYVALHGEPPRNGDVYVHESGFVFMRQNNNWHRMQPLSDNTSLPSVMEMASWTNQGSNDGQVQITTKWPGRDRIEVGGREYRATGSDVGWDNLPKEVQDLFSQVHNNGQGELTKNGMGDGNNARVVYHNGEFWYAKSGRLMNTVRYLRMEPRD